MLDKVRNTIVEYSLILPGELVVIGVSGGPDSIALLHCLHQLSVSMHFGLHVVHVNHGLRPEAKEEAVFVRNFAKGLGIDTTVRCLDPEELRQGSLQELAREKRREIFLHECEVLGASKVALGHNANDQAETVLQRLLRGGGSSGLGGIHPKREMFIRPMIFVSRKEIEKYLQHADLDFRVDKSNFKTVYLRNKIRLNLIPVLENEYNPRFVEAVGKTAIILQEDNLYLENEAEKKFNELATKIGNYYFLPNSFGGLPRAITTRIIRRVFAILAKEPRGLEHDHVVKVLDYAVNGRGGSSLELPANVKVLKEIDGLLFYTGVLSWPGVLEKELAIPGETAVSATGIKINCRIVDSTTMSPEDLWSMAMNASDFPGRIWIRKRKPGDKIFVRGKYKKLKEVFNDLRIPIRVRETTPVVLKDDEIIWIPGIIKSDFYAEGVYNKALELIVSNN